MLKLNVLLIYLLLVNLYAFALYGIDKSKAKSGKWRISERHLLLSALFGGSFGAALAMKTFRHKTKHNIFKFGVPFMLMLHLVALGFAVVKGWIAL